MASDVHSDHARFELCKLELVECIARGVRAFRCNLVSGWSHRAIGTKANSPKPRSRRTHRPYPTRQAVARRPTSGFCHKALPALQPPTSSY
ncbi:hypothetical protein CALCODRAFT_502213 [Calocera cornea HHB12733]|uniref:Uncharacterized protein n=1 Tax=Calocera cornea HHB12733 TaxID=1353952 RepID=A0A165DCF0_9BASI|nr:hypothetical protein CALCODRAFT_502213 [Calocera cornea HHB12733]